MATQLQDDIGVLKDALPDDIFHRTLKLEGGFTVDEGGDTNLGITQTLLDNYNKKNGLPAKKVKDLDTDYAKRVYSDEFYVTPKFNMLPHNVGSVLFDDGVQSSPARAAKRLQRVIGAKEDGLIGPKTIKATEDFIQKNGEKALLQDLVDDRVDFLKTTPAYKAKPKGIMNRINQIKQEFDLSFLNPFHTPEASADEVPLMGMEDDAGVFQQAPALEDDLGILGTVSVEPQPDWKIQGIKNIFEGGRTMAVESAKGALRGMQGIAGSTGSLVNIAGQNMKISDEKREELKAKGLADDAWADRTNKVADKLIEWGATARDYWKNASREGIAAPDPELFTGEFMANPSWTRASALIAEAVPSLGAAVMASVATGGNPIAGLAFLGAIQGAETFEEAQDAGTSLGKANLLFGMSAVGTSALEAVPLGRFLKGGSGELTKDIFSGMTLEGSEEVAQQLWTNVIAKFGYEETRDLTQGMVESLIAGAGSGGVIGGLTSGKSAELDKSRDAALKAGVPPEALDAMQEAVAKQIVTYADNVEAEINKPKGPAIEITTTSEQTQMIEDATAMGKVVGIDAATKLPIIDTTKPAKPKEISPADSQPAQPSAGKQAVQPLEASEPAKPAKDAPEPIQAPKKGIVAGSQLVFDDIKKQLLDVGFTEDEASKNAELWKARSEQAAKQQGITPEAWYEKVRPEIKSGDEAPSPEAMTQDDKEIQEQLEYYRAQRNTAAYKNDKSVAQDIEKKIRKLEAGDKLFQDQPDPFYSQLSKVIEEKMPNAATPEMVRGILSDKNGVRAEEYKWMGVDDFLAGKTKVTKKELQDFIRQNQVEVKEVEHREYISGTYARERAELDRQLAAGEITDVEFNDRAVALKNDQKYSDNTKFQNYQLPGGKNYRELLLTLPIKKPDVKRFGEGKWTIDGKPATRQEALSADNNKGFKSSHFDEPNILAHVRMNDRVDADGKKVLFVEEVQSDWHQKGRKEGYKNEKARKDFDEYVEELRKKYKTNALIINTRELTSDELAKYQELFDATKDFGEAVPDAPFKKTWHELAMKRMLRYAAENGYDRLAWTTGEQQAERYDLSKQVENVNVRKRQDGTYNIAVTKKDESGLHVIKEVAQENELPDILGKDLAAKIVKQEAGSVVKYEGVDLKVGGEGMKGFYDQILPAFMNKYAKKWGGRVGETKIDGTPIDGDIKKFLELDDIAKNGELTDIQSKRYDDLYDKFYEQMNDIGSDRSVLEYVRNLIGKAKVHSIDITPSMKKSVMEGQPLFQGGQQPRGWVELKPGEKTKLILTARRDASTFMHESAHIWLQDMYEFSKVNNLNKEAFNDWGILIDWLEIKPDQKSLSRDQHEKFARGFEAYLREGKAPSSALRAVFENFKEWLTKIYKSLEELDVKINPEVTGVFDRMLAGDQKIDVFHGSKEKDFKYDPAKQRSGYYPGLYTSIDKVTASGFGANVKNAKIDPSKFYPIEGPKGSDNLKAEAEKAGFGYTQGSGKPEVDYLKSKGYGGIRRGEEYIIFPKDEGITLYQTGKPQYSEPGKQQIRDVADLLAASDNAQLIKTDTGYSRLASGWPVFLSDRGYTRKELDNLFSKALNDEKLTEAQIKKLDGIIADYRDYVGINPAEPPFTGPTAGNEGQAEGEKRRKFIKTVKEAEKTSPEVARMIESYYTVIGNAQTLDEAKQLIANDINEAQKLVEGNEPPSRVSNTVALLLIDKAQQEGRFEDAKRLVERTAEKNTAYGQTIQALSMYRRLDPAGILRYAERVIRQAEDKQFGQPGNKDYRPAGFKGKFDKELTEELTRRAKKLGEAPQWEMPSTPEAKNAIQFMIESFQKLGVEGQNSLPAEVKNALQFAIEEFQKLGVAGENTPEAKNAMQKVFEEFQKLGVAGENTAMGPGIQTFLNVGYSYAQRKQAIETALMLNEIKKRIDPGILRKISMGQTLAQLLNTKTMVRNLFGNAALVPVENLSDAVGTAIDIAASVFTGKRTMWLPDPKTQVMGFMQGAREGTEEALLGINLKKINSKFDIPQDSVFDSGVLGALEKTLKVSLGAADRAFYQAAFNDSIRRQMQGLNEESLTPEMIETAHYEGLYRTFQDRTALSIVMEGLKKAMNINKEWGVGDAVIKYAKTPALIISRGIEYSPFGFINTSVQLLRPALPGKYKRPFDQYKFTRASSRALTGSTLLVGTGFLLASLGIISGKPDDDEDVRNTLANSGIKGYQINLSALKRFLASGLNKEVTELREGDLVVNYDWLQPAAIGLAMGANMYLAKDKNKVDAAINMIDRLAEASNTIVDQPLLTGIQTMTKYRDIGRGVLEITKGIPASFVPTFFNQVRQLTDNVSRNTKAPWWQETFVTRPLNKIPGASRMLPPNVTPLGKPREIYQNDTNNPFNVFLNPAFAAKYKPDATSRLVLDIWKRSGHTEQFPRSQPRRVDFGKSNVELTASQSFQYQTYIGERTDALFTAFANNPGYMRMSDEQQAKILQRHLTNIKAEAKRKFFEAEQGRTKKDLKYIFKEIKSDKMKIENSK